MHAWDKSEASDKTNIGGIFSMVTLLIAVGALVLALKRPDPVAPPLTPASMAAHAQSFQGKVEQLAQSQGQGQGGAEVRLTAPEITAALAQAAGQVATPPATNPAHPSVDPNAALGAGSADQALLGEPIINFEGDVVHGQFLTEIAGKKVTVTVSGHLGAKDGYATFDPTEFKIGELSVPVSLVNGSLQKKLLEQRDRLKLPDSVRDLRVENGELVLKQK
jgi:hypothetical protein